MTYKQKWISVDTKLPPDPSWVLVYSDGAMACRGYSKKRFQDWEGCSNPGLNINEISHWMNLPDAPESTKSIGEMMDDDWIDVLDNF